MLNLIVSKPQCFAGTDFSKYKKEIHDAEIEGHKVVGISYFHGNLESALGYDIGLCLNGEEITDDKNNLLEGIYDAQVKDYDGKIKAFLWTGKHNKEIRGLIVDEKDSEALKYAEEMYSNKEDYI